MSDSHFLERGFELYPEACQAVAGYQRHLFERLDRALDASLRGHRFSPVKRTSFTGGSSVDGWYVGYTQTGKAASKQAAIELGFWWNAPGCSQPVVYCILHSANGFDAGSCPEGMSAFSWKGRIGLAAPFARDLDVQKLLGRLIACALNEL